MSAKSAVSAPISTMSSPSLFSLMISPAEITPVNAWQLFSNVAPLAKVVDLIADEVARLKPLVEVQGQPVDDHPVMQFLARPGFNRTRQRFIKELAIQYLVCGTSYMHVYGQTSRMPLALDVLKSRFVMWTPGADMWPDRYQYSEGTRSLTFLRDDNPRDFRWLDGAGLGEIVPMYDMDGNNRGVGLPRLNAIRADVELRLKGIQHNSGLLDNGARLSGVLAFKDGLTEDQRADVSNMMRAMFTGSANSGKVLVTSGGEMDFTSMMQSAKDMDFAKLMSLVEDAIVSRYNVPITLFRTDAQTQNNYEVAWRIFYQLAVMPVFDNIYGSLAHVFNERMDPQSAQRGQQIAFVHDALTNPILAQQASARAVELFNAHMISRNEARYLIGYEPALGGDTIYGPMGEVPVGEDFFTGHDADALTADNYHTARDISPNAPGNQRPSVPADDQVAAPGKAPKGRPGSADEGKRQRLN